MVDDKQQLSLTISTNSRQYINVSLAFFSYIIFWPTFCISRFFTSFYINLDFCLFTVVTSLSSFNQPDPPPSCGRLTSTRLNYTVYVCGQITFYTYARNITLSEVLQIQQRSWWSAPTWRRIRHIRFVPRTVHTYTNSDLL